MISGNHREVGQKCALLYNYAVSSGNSLSIFQDKLSIPSSGFKNLRKKPLKMKPRGCPKI